MGKSFLEVDVLAAKGSRKTAFTYVSDTQLKTGQLVKVPLADQQSLGVVRRAVPKPDYATKSVLSVLPVPALSTIYLQLADWITDYYATPKARVWATMLPSASLTVSPRSAATSKPRSAIPVNNKLELTSGQSQALKQIRSTAHSNFLLHGVTGSGKTQIYIELAKEALRQGKSIIILVPEISLTPQILAQFSASFDPEAIVLTHSGLSAAQRRDAWLKVHRSLQPQVIIGPRSALFLPVVKLAYVVLDEAHDQSYKQDQSPRYNAYNVAAYLAKLHQAKLVLGTATPSLTSFYAAQQSKLKLLAIDQPVFTAQNTPPVIVDLKQAANLKRSYLLSEPLLDKLALTLDKNRQSILFLNRRGSARLLLCPDCGWQALCPHCHIPLIWHQDQGQLMCHWCNYRQQPPASCPQCQSLNIRFVGSGTKRLEAELQKFFPTARIKRLDKDSFNPSTISQLYNDLASGQIDILLGTQMITKGLDLPGVETVGIVLADNMLYLPDFSSSERTFQLLYQVSGRAGRRTGSLANIVIQTYSPKHPAIIAAAQRSYRQFYEQELAERQALGYPPFKYLLKLWVTKSSRQTAQTATTKLAQQLKKACPDAEIIGPAPSWQETIGGNYRWQIIVKSKQRATLQNIVRQYLPGGWGFDLDPLDLL